MPDVFISYSRRDQDFVRWLHDALTERGRDVWVDWEGIPPTAEWMEELRRSIEAADAFLYVITPDSAGSTVCTKEVELATAGNKRLIPVVRRDVPPSEVPERVAALNWIFLRESDDAEEGLERVVAALDTDLDWVQAHTRLLVRANEWEQRGRDGSLLLRGGDLSAAEEAVAAATGREPGPTELQNEYLLASRRAASRRQRLGITAALGVALVSLVLGAIAFVQRNEARNQQQIATSRERAATSLRVASENPELGLLLAGRAADVRLTDEVREALVNALRRWPLIKGFTGKDGPLTAAAVTPDRRFAVTTGTANVVRVWDLVTGGSRVLGEGVPPAQRLSLSADGSAVLTPGGGGARLWPRAGGEPTVLREPNVVISAAFVPGGRQVITGDFVGDARIWDLDGPRVVRTLAGRAAQRRHGLVRGGGRGRGQAAVQDVAVTADGRFAATAFLSQTTYVWDARRGRYLWKLSGGSVAFSPNSRLLAVAERFSVRLWDVSRRRSVALLANHTGDVRSLAFSADGARLVTAGDDRTVRVWDVGERRQLAVLVHAAPVRDARFSPDDEVVVAADNSGRLTVWDPGQTSPLVATGEGSRAAVFVGSNRLAVADRAGARLLDDRLGATVAALGDAVAAGLDLDVSRSGIVATVGEDRSLRLVDGERGVEVWQTRLPAPADAVTFSPDGRRLVTAGRDGVARIWDVRERRLLSSLRYPAPLSWAGLAADGHHAFAITNAGVNAELVIWRDEEVHRRENPAVADVSPDGSRLARLTDDDVRIAGLGADEEIVLGGEDAAFQFLPVFSADARLFLTAGRTDRVARVWDLESRRVVARMPGRAQASGAAFSRDGRLVAVGRRDGEVNVFEASTGRRVVTLDAGTIAAYMRFGPRGDALAIIDQDGRGRLLSCDACRPVEDLVSLARSRATRDLTEDERRTYLHE